MKQQEQLSCKNCPMMKQGRHYSPFCSALGSYSLAGDIPFIGDVTMSENKTRSDCPLVKDDIIDKLEIRGEIKEIESILQQEQIKIANTVEEFVKLQKVGITRCNAEALYESNCRIIHENAVVITKEKYENLKTLPERLYNAMEKKMEEKVKSVLFEIFAPYKKTAEGQYVFTIRDKNKLYEKYGIEEKI